MIARAVLDSSVLVPAWSRVVLQRLAAADPPWFEPVWSEWIIAETWRTLAWRSSKEGEPWPAVSHAANLMLRRLLPVMRTIPLRDAAAPPVWPSLRDQDDEPIWTTAVVGSAQYVVSDNVHHFPPLVDLLSAHAGAPERRHIHGGIEYLTAVEFIESVLQQDTEMLLGTTLRHVPVRSSRTVPRA